MPRVDWRVPVADPGNRGARKIQRVVVEIEDDFDDVGIHDVGGPCDSNRQGRDRDLFVGLDGFDGRVNRGRLDQRLIPLHVHENVVASVDCRCGHFGDALGAGPVFGARHHCFPSKAGHGLQDALIISGDNHAGNSFGEPHARPHPFDHGFSGQSHQRLAREPGGGVSSGNNSEGHESTLMGCPRVNNPHGRTSKCYHRSLQVECNVSFCESTCASHTQK